MYECNVSEKLVALRIKKGVTQDDVAQSLFVSNKTISRWENGTSLPDLPMLIGLSKYYGVTTDSLLGLAEEKKQSTKDEVRSAFKGLNRREAILKAFETVRSIIPAIFGTVSNEHEGVNSKNEVLPSVSSRFYRSNIALNEFFEFVASSNDVNVAVMMLRNKSDFAWMNDPEKQKKITRLFRFLSNEDSLSVLYFISSAKCPESFTADYISTHTDVCEERVCEILEEFCSVGECSRVTAHLSEGEVNVYECFGDGMILSLVSLAFERMCGKRSYEFNCSGKCKMIGGR